MVADMGEDSSPGLHLELEGEGQALCGPALRSSVSLLRVPFDRKNLETIRLPKLTQLETSPIPIVPDPEQLDLLAREVLPRVRK